MHAIIETGGKQYKVTEGDTLFIEKLEAYTIVDVNTRITDQVANELRAIPGVIRVRVLNH